LVLLHFGRPSYHGVGCAWLGAGWKKLNAVFARTSLAHLELNEMKKSKVQSPMLVEERRQHILSLIQKHGRVLVDELSSSLDLSKITIRKDLDYLQAKDLLVRTHGGALPAQAGASLSDPTIQEKGELHHEEKVKIAKAAAAMISEEQCIILDSGTTTTEIARAILSFRHLTVITNALNIAADLARSDFEIILIGGTLRKNSLSVVGPLAEDVLKEMHADIVFIGVDGFDLEVGLTTPNVLEARVNRAMVKAAAKVVAVCDSSKFNRRSLSLIVGTSAIDHVITDSKLPEEEVKAIRDAGIEVTVV
jgi:DeoR family transcriptional regulator, aga operon transcriptional repressor